MFIISVKSEKQISQGFAGFFWMWTIFGLLLALGSGIGWMIQVGPASRLGWLPLVIMGLGYLLIFMLVYSWTTFNNLINLHHRVEQAWSQVDVQLKRRYDLIPNLVKVVEGYQQYEKETQTAVTAMRNQLAATPFGAEGTDYQGLTVTLRAVSEKYPELKANENFLKLQKALADSENRIALARDYFNQVTTFYNTRLEIIPERWVAGLASLKPRFLMMASDFERAPVIVTLEE
jgi:hypothetical protein